jgi:DNA adenine methylase
MKCQGIKTKLVPFILSNIKWSAGKNGRWIEPFLGSGVVALNLAPPSALLADTNPHIIKFYQDIQTGEINRTNVKEFLVNEGQKLAQGGADYYYEVRQRFNEKASSLDFLFLNRACFNGVMRFNRSGQFNVPFGHKPLRFSQSYITKITNQVGWVAQQMQGKAWEFRVSSWEQTLAMAQATDFVYADPPYIARHTDYYSTWDETSAIQMATVFKNLQCGFAVSMWLENKYRQNTYVAEYWAEVEKRTQAHFYHVGASEDLRHAMTEVLLIKPGFASDLIAHFNFANPPLAPSYVQLGLNML